MKNRKMKKAIALTAGLLFCFYTVVPVPAARAGDFSNLNTVGAYDLPTIHLGATGTVEPDDASNSNGPVTSLEPIHDSPIQPCLKPGSSGSALAGDSGINTGSNTASDGDLNHDGKIDSTDTDGTADSNHDGVIDAKEIANASQALLRLDENGDGQLTREELRPPPPPEDLDGPPPGEEDPHFGPPREP